MTIASALLLLALAEEPASPPADPPATAGAETAAPAPASPPVAPKSSRKTRPSRPAALQRASLPTVEGEVTQVDFRAHTLRIRTGSAEVILTFDRNTLVSSPSGEVTPLQIRPGARVRAGRDGDTRAAWLELAAPSSTAAPTP